MKLPDFALTAALPSGDNIFGVTYVQDDIIVVTSYNKSKELIRSIINTTQRGALSMILVFVNNTHYLTLSKINDLFQVFITNTKKVNINKIKKLVGKGLFRYNKTANTVEFQVKAKSINELGRIIRQYLNTSEHFTMYEGL